MHTILLVEDDPKLAELLTSYLAKYEYTVVVPKDFGDVLGAFERARPDLVLLSSASSSSSRRAASCTSGCIRILTTTCSSSR